MVIVEGPDGGGKTTLVNKLARDLRLPIAPRVVGANTLPLAELKSWTERNVHAGFQRVLFDRHRLISEPIYSAAMGRETDTAFYDLGWMREMTDLFYGLRPIIIYCLPAPQVVLANVSDENSDNEVILPAIKHIYAGYVNRTALDLSRGVGRLYNYKVTRYDDLVGWVHRQLEERLGHVSAERISFPRQADSEAVDRGRNSAARRTIG